MLIPPSIRDNLFDCEEEPFPRELVAKLERVMGVHFPDDYIEFLVQYNRPGCNNPLEFNVPTFEHPKQSIIKFFGRKPEEYGEFNDYLDKTDAFGDEVPGTHVAIARSVGLSYVVLSYVNGNSKFDGIGFWDTEAHPGRGEQVVYPVADTFTDLLNSLKVEFDRFEQIEPLFQAVERCEYETVERYLAEGGDPNRRNWDGVPLLIVASQNRWPKIVDLLLRNSADPNIRDRTGKTALHYVAISSYDVSKLLLAAGANVNVRDKKGRGVIGYGRTVKLIDARRAKK